MTSNLPPISHVLETILYVKSMSRSVHFYTNTLGLQYMNTSPRGTSFALGNSVLLLFQQGVTGEDVVEDESKPEIRIAKHGPTDDIISALLGSEESRLRQHFCLAVNTPDEVKQWEGHLKGEGVEIIGKINWERGGYSFYFADPDGHCGEVASRGLWKNY